VRMFFIFGIAKKDEQYFYLGHFEVRYQKFYGFFATKNVPLWILQCEKCHLRLARPWSGQNELVKLLGHASTLEVSFEAVSKPFFDRLDIFSDATDLKNTLVLLFLRHLTPQSQINYTPSRRKVTELGPVHEVGCADL